MGQFILKPSFAGGELTPALYGRTDFPKYDVGASCIKNAVVLRYGGVSRREGFRFITHTKSNKKARLIPFSYNADQNYILEFTDKKIRFFTQGGIIVDNNDQPIEVTTPYTEADLPKINYTQSADVLFLVHPNYPPATLTRNSFTSWTYAVMDIINGPFDEPNTTDVTITSNYFGFHPISLTASENFFDSSMVGQLMRIGYFLPSQYAKGIPNADASQYSVTANKFEGTISGSFSGEVEGSYNYTYYDEEQEQNVTILQQIRKTVSGSITGTYEGKDLSNEIDGYVTGGTLSVTIDSLHSITYPNFTGYIRGAFDGTKTGTSESSTFREQGLKVQCVPGSSVYVESFGFWDGYFEVSKKDDNGDWVSLKRQSGNRSQNYSMEFSNDDDVIREYRVTSTDFDTTVHQGEDVDQRGYVTIQTFSNDFDLFVQITDIVHPTQAHATIINNSSALRNFPEFTFKATNNFSLSAWSGSAGYPQAVGFFEDRLVFAGSPKNPQTYWASKTGDYINFGVSYPQQDDDAITGTLASGQMNGIKAIVSFGEMIMLTSGGEYRVSGGGENFTPKNQQARAQEYRGISDVSPVIIGGRIVYVQQHGNIIRDLAYSYDVDKYTGDDVSLLAAHLFDGQNIKSMTYQQIPNSVVWCVRDDGVLCGMTYVKEQDVYAWHKHDTDGTFIDVCSIPGENADELWAVIKRGNDYSVEQMVPGSGCYLDSYYYNINLDSDTVTGLTWLAGKTVQAVVNGGIKLENLEVNNAGTVNLGRTYESAVIGLPYTTQISTMPIEINGQDGTWAARKKRIQAMTIFFQDTLGGRYGIVSGDILHGGSWPNGDEIKWRTSESMGTRTNLFTGKKKVILPQSSYDDMLFLCITQDEPFSLTVLSVIPEVLPGG